MSNVDFSHILSNAGIPNTQDALNKHWQQVVAASDSQINNDNSYSPFWRVINALITTPALWLINLLIDTVIPNAFVKTATGPFLDILADGVNLTRKQAVQAQGSITFTRANSEGQVTIPLGTIIQTAAIAGKIFRLQTTEQGIFAEGKTEVDVAVQAIEAGSEFNLATGYYALLVEPIAGIISVCNNEGWLTRPGTDEESDDNLRVRIRNQFGTASDHHTDSVYRSLISQFPGVASDAIWFEHNAPRGPGTANAYVLFDFAMPAADYLKQINHFITDQGHHGHGDDLVVYQMPERQYTLDITVWHNKFLTLEEISELQSNINDFIFAAFRENKLYKATLPLPYSRFSFSKLGEEIHQQFAHVLSVDFNLTDLVTELWIPRLNSLTFTMQGTE